MPFGRSTKIMDAQAEVGTSEGIRSMTSKRTIQVIGSTSSGAGAATVLVEGTLDDTVGNGQNWVTLATFNLTLSTTAVSDGIAIDTVWLFHRVNITAISGTGASVTAYLGTES